MRRRSGDTRKFSISSRSSCVTRCSVLSAIAMRQSALNSVRSWPLAPSSTKIASSPDFSDVFSASVFACSARNTIAALSFAHSKDRIAPV